MVHSPGEPYWLFFLGCKYYCWPQPIDANSFYLFSLTNTLVYDQENIVNVFLCYYEHVSMLTLAFSSKPHCAYRQPHVQLRAWLQTPGCFSFFWVTRGEWHLHSAGITYTINILCYNSVTHKKHPWHLQRRISALGECRGQDSGKNLGKYVSFIWKKKKKNRQS